ncbi:hypothetical protein LSTR_LSTR012691 [Laodelphax striatellus]|uniref:Uncharacterized protein n=1 Tax=Laodelphax striatellus TaxID=195883 RepID=A0A482X1V4_LAOST|nr:hypothetical protein LSTR_LSTR012691 [Laodelphax striatellus]
MKPASVSDSLEAVAATTLQKALCLVSRYSAPAWDTNVCVSIDIECCISWCIAVGKWPYLSILMSITERRNWIEKLFPLITQAFNRKEVDEVGNIFVAVFYKRFPAGCGTVIHSMHERNATANHRRGVPEMRQPAPIADNTKKKQEENKKKKTLRTKKKQELKKDRERGEE